MWAGFGRLTHRRLLFGHGNRVLISGCARHTGRSMQRFGDIKGIRLVRAVVAGEEICYDISNHESMTSD